MLRQMVQLGRLQARRQPRGRYSSAPNLFFEIASWYKFRSSENLGSSVHRLSWCNDRKRPRCLTSTIDYVLEPNSTEYGWARSGDSAASIPAGLAGYSPTRTARASTPR